MRHGFLSTARLQSNADKSETRALRSSERAFDRLFEEPARAYPDGRSEEEVHAALLDISEARRGAKDTDLRNDPNAIPAGYTYLGQFIIHDLTRSQIPAKGSAPINRATPSLDLDSVYGGGPALCPHFFQQPTDMKDLSHLFYVGRTAAGHQPENARMPGNLPLDLPRVGAGTQGISETGDKRFSCPLIADIRNDENLVVSQIHGLFLQVHNRVAAFLHESRSLTGRESFQRARKFVIRSYRQIVVHDYLKQLLLDTFYNEVRSDTPAFIQKEVGRSIPLEFTFGAARVCHAMSRHQYAVNSHIRPSISTLANLLHFSSHRSDAPLPLPADWVIDWQNFFRISPAMPPLTARPLSPLLSPVFIDAQTSLTDNAPHDSLSFRDLWRCYDQKLPTGQDCAREVAKILGDKIPMKVLEDSDLLPTDKLAEQQFVEPLRIAVNQVDWFKTHTPLTYYLAQEASSELGDYGRKFGPVGSYIMARTFRRALGIPAEGTTESDEPERYDNSSPQGVASMPDFIRLLNLWDGELIDQIEATTPGLTKA